VLCFLATLALLPNIAAARVVVRQQAAEAAKTAREVEV
jgi:hypothetical protein